GALAAPAAIGQLGLIGTPLEDWALVLFAAAIGAVYQLFALCAVLLQAIWLRLSLPTMLALDARVTFIYPYAYPYAPPPATGWVMALPRPLAGLVNLLVTAVFYGVLLVWSLCLPVWWIASMVYAFHLYVHRQGAREQALTIAALGTIALKLVLIPLVF